MEDNLRKLQSLIITAELLTTKLREVAEDPRYTAPWIFWSQHGMKYDGPFYVDELDSLERAIKSLKNDTYSGRHDEPSAKPDEGRV